MKILIIGGEIKKKSLSEEAYKAAGEVRNIGCLERNEKECYSDRNRNLS